MRINSKSFVKFFVAMFLLMSIATVAPTTMYAAWWNPFSWFNKEKPVDGQKPNPSEVKDTAEESQPTDATQKESVEIEKDTANVVAPQSNANDAKTIDDLKVEIATLKTSLDSLYKAHNNLVNDHNALLEYTKSIATANKTAGTAINSTLNTRVSDLEKKLNDVCGQVFSSIGSLSSNRCPSSQLQIKESLESRIKKLEGGY